MKARWLAVLLLLGAVACGLGMASWAQASCTITVQPGESIQQAIDSASPGDVICLAEGTWKENVMIEKSLTLRGAGREKSIIKGKKWGEPVILIESDSQIEVVIEGLTVAEAKGEHTIGIEITGKATVTIRNSKISGNGYGIHMWGSAQATISGAEISGNRHYGIEMEGSAQATISGSEISGNGDDGIRMEDSSRAEISDSEISGNDRDGIVMKDSSQATISGSESSGNDRDGIVMVDSSQVTISGSEISGNGRAGIRVYDSSQATISDSQISGNGGNGISMWGSSQATIRDNEIYGNKDYGVVLYLKRCGFEYGAEEFLGKVEGGGNRIYDNGKGNVCPPELAFLMTEEGGCYGALCKGG